MRTLLAIFRTARNRNSVHPPNPPIGILLVGLLLVVSVLSANGQLMEYPTYALPMKAYLNRQWTAERAEFTDLQRGKNWNMVPSVGLVFGLPSVSLNTGQIASYKQRQGETKAKLKSIDLRYELLLNESLNQLRIEVEKAETERAKLGMLGELMTSREKIFKVYKESFTKREMAPLLFYKEEIAFAQSKQEYQLAAMSFQVVILNIEKLAHYGAPSEHIYYDADARPEGATSLMEVDPSNLPESLFTKTSRFGAPIPNPLGN